MKDADAITGPEADASQPPQRLGPAASQVVRRLRRPALAPVRLAVVVAQIDLVAMALALWFAAYAASPAAAFAPWAAAGWAIAAAGIGVLAGLASGSYRISRLARPRIAVPAGLAATLLAAALLAAVAPAGAGGAAVLLTAVPAAAAIVAPARLAVAGVTDWAVACGLTERRAVLAGSGAEAERLVRGLAARPGNNIRIHAVFDDRGPDRVPERILDVPLIGDFDDLVAFCREGEIDLILLTLPPEAERRIAELMERLRVLPVGVHLTAASRDFAFRSTRPGAGLLLPASFRPEQRLVKRAFDLVFGGLLAALFAPVMALIALAVRLDSPGPALFAQTRHGFNDRPVRVWKFRTMHTAACDPAGRAVVTRGDPRVTRVGRVLRKTSLDELPQLFNVLAGTLSLVGPRPHAMDARSSRRESFARLVSGYSARHRLPPGITGWAQIHGLRGEVDDPETLRARVDHDLWYIENWSFALDLSILLRTPLSLLDTRRAY